MKSLLCILFLIIFLTEGVAQNKFNRLYRFDSSLYNSVQFHTMKIVNNAIYTAGIGVVIDSTYLTNPGIFTKFDLQGNLIYNKYQGRFPVSNEFRGDLFVVLPNNDFSLTGSNWDSSFSVVMVNKSGDQIFTKQHFPSPRNFRYSAPRSITQLSDNHFVLAVNETRLGNTKSSIFFVDSLGNKRSSYNLESTWEFMNPLQMSLSKSKKLNVMTRAMTGDFQNVNFQYVTQLYELDTLGNVLWRYQTPTNRYIYGDGFVQLANSNYLMWGYEEYSRPDAVNRFRLLDSVRPFLREIKPNVGVVWEKNFSMLIQPTIFDLKILKDSSIVFVGRYIDTTNVLLKQGYLIKLNKNRDSVYKRTLVHPTFSHGMAFYFPEKIEELDNGDLVIAGYAQDNKVGSPTRYTWGWLIRTDSLGCSLEPTCRVPTQEVEKGPLSIKAFPNPAKDVLTIEYTPENNDKDLDITVSDVMGKVVIRQSLDVFRDPLSINVSNLSVGLYFCTFTVKSKGSATQKVVIVR